MPHPESGKSKSQKNGRQRGHIEFMLLGPPYPAGECVTEATKIKPKVTSFEAHTQSIVSGTLISLYPKN